MRKPPLPVGPDRWRCRLRAMAFEVGNRSAQQVVDAVGRVDIMARADRPCRIGAPSSARFDSAAASPRSLADDQLEKALWTPRPPDFFIVAHPGAVRLIPDRIRRGAPVIVAFRAVVRLWTRVPPEGGKDHVRDFAPGQTPSEREALLIGKLVGAMLAAASPGELVWLSQPAKYSC